MALVTEQVACCSIGGVFGFGALAGTGLGAVVW